LTLNQKPFQQTVRAFSLLPIILKGNKIRHSQQIKISNTKKKTHWFLVLINGSDTSYIASATYTNVIRK
tara:strand:+ start:1172 stop:1378 length:207 start_codon:yes stop_codon:yes gene_type:complete